MKNLKSFLFIFLAVILGSFVSISCKQQAEDKAKTTEAQEEISQEASAEEEGWIVMFNGESTDGWRNYNKETFPEQGWVIEDQALRCIGSGQGEAGGKGGDIIYDQKFKDFHLKLEWKISKGGNSGIFYLARELEGEPIWKSAPEMQILDNERHIDANMGENGNRKAGSLYDLIPAEPQNTKPAGEWNSVEIMVYQGTVIHKQNGEVVVEYHLGTPDWEEMVANSKFADFPEFGKYVEGYIGLQDHGNDVWFRDIMIKDLSVD
ncbi:MAG: 3-keto-disaccharide hydrolase [Bacteroidota bacterium]